MNNIPEGHGRFVFSNKSNLCFNCDGSLEEFLDDLNVCEDEAYCRRSEIETLKSRQEGWRVHKLLNGYIRYLRSVSPEVPQFGG